ncbi:hypothetical protein K505DRAFT_331618 [Melanomma pulvis-pyrius CBS 109.77]|uniref:Uncharacterized protein n=1 Tax=Melanomma pulvis-pyrius CBS 109.77 TaxID=1314802 RepID=A0A6A6XWZ1_9PLEO|nr:hypothetical protein K505DRAFT_331618 [Melanomma pulvis-pyrius CBS 109.77]
MSIILECSMAVTASSGQESDSLVLGLPRDGTHNLGQTECHGTSNFRTNTQSLDMTKGYDASDVKSNLNVGTQTVNTKRRRSRPKSLDIDRANSLKEHRTEVEVSLANEPSDQNLSASAKIPRENSPPYPPRVVKIFRQSATSSRLPSSENHGRHKPSEHPKRPGVLSAGPSGYVRTPVSARPAGYEAFRDHGIRPKKERPVLFSLSIVSLLCNTEHTIGTKSRKLVIKNKLPVPPEQTPKIGAGGGSVKMILEKKFRSLKKFFRKKM